MRNIKRYKELFESQTELSQEQTEWLDKYTIGSWTLNTQTGLVDVDGDFNCYYRRLTDFKGVRFGVVTGYFYCYHNRLTSLEGAPQSVGGGFDCSNNWLTSLKDAPLSVNGGFDCSLNKLTSLEGVPLDLRGDFYCSKNPVSESVLKALYKKMQSGMSWPDAVASHWRYIRSEEEKILLAPYNHTLSSDELKGYQALAKLRKRMI
jgi:hypothetical protein